MKKKNTEILHPINSKKEKKQLELFERLHEESK